MRLYSSYGLLGDSVKQNIKIGLADSDQWAETRKGPYRQTLVFIRHIWCLPTKTSIFSSNILYLYIYEGRRARVKSPYSNSYRELAESTMSFNRRLNEERRMRIPYIDGQVGKEAGLYMRWSPRISAIIIWGKI
jgi:hypothetical protein